MFVTLLSSNCKSMRTDRVRNNTPFLSTLSCKQPYHIMGCIQGKSGHQPNVAQALKYNYTLSVVAVAVFIICW